MATTKAKAAGDKVKDERIAVIFVHGQGEQTPMFDVMELAESVWRTDPRAQPDPDGGLAEIYSTPVASSEKTDQRRIATLKAAGRRVDFYQFYWADLMEGNRFTHLWGWFTRLMKRNPDEIPTKIWPIRQATMFIALAIGVWATALGLLSSVRLGVFATSYGIWAVALGLVFGLSSARSDQNSKRFLILFVVTLAGLLSLIVWSLLDYQEHLKSLALFAGCAVLTVGLYLQAKAPPGAWPGNGLVVFKSWLFWAAIAVFMLVGSVGLLVSAGKVFEVSKASPGVWLAFVLIVTTGYLAPQLLFESRRAVVFSLGLPLAVIALGATLLPTGPQGLAIEVPSWILDSGVQGFAFLGSVAGVIVLIALGWLLSKTFLVPVMADSARMFSNSPVNIPNQNKIRARGLELLRDLHDPSRSEKRRYDRIVILAHSLGTVVAYRLISHYWGAVYEQISGHPEAQAVEDAAETNNPKALREAVRRYGDAVAKSNAGDSPWKITDFVTIGSPLTYGALLMEESNAEFIKQRDGLKRYPTAPPQALDPRLDPLKLFKRFSRPHHASLFAATCWTNLYFPPKGLAEGDLVGGPLGIDLGSLGYGRGVLDVNLGHDASVSGFTHGEYWRWPNGAEHRLLPGNGTPGAESGPFVVPHVAAIRDALCLFGDYDAACSRLLDPVGSYPNSNFR